MVHFRDERETSEEGLELSVLSPTPTPHPHPPHPRSSVTLRGEEEDRGEKSLDEYTPVKHGPCVLILKKKGSSFSKPSA